MPIATDPKHRCAFVLESDRGKPKGKKPTFFFRGMAIREASSFAEQVDAASVDRSGDETIAELAKLVRSVLVGWTNMADAQTGKKIRYDPESLLDLVTFDELWQLAIGAISPRAVQAADLKNSGSQLPSNSAGSADPAATKPAAGSAPTA